MAIGSWPSRAPRPGASRRGDGRDDRGTPGHAPVDLREVYPRAVRRYVPGRYDGLVVVFRAGESRLERPSDLGWSEVADRVEVREARGAHLTMITWHVAALGEQVRACLEKAQEPWGDAG